MNRNSGPWLRSPMKDPPNKVSQRVNESVGQTLGQTSAFAARGSVAVPGCEFQRRPGACFFDPPGLAARRRLNPQARTPTLRKITKRSHFLRSLNE
jgi:hypothetical protein